MTAALLAPLLAPSRLLAVRDLLTFHLPLRAVLRQLLLSGAAPRWNPFLHAGQPILSNPNYAAFYPPAWAVLPLAPHHALGVLVVAHALFGAWGTWRLLRRLGVEAPAAGLATLAWGSGTWCLGLTGTLNFFVGMAWHPWVLALTVSLLEAPRGRPARRMGVLLAATLTLQTFAGEPVAVLVSAAGAAALAVGRVPRGLVTRLLPAAGLAALLAAIQIVPTAARLEGSSRAELAPGSAATWSAPPARLADFVFPRMWGDAMRDEQGLWFGWGVHDRDFPYVVALSSGLLAVALALAAAFTWPVPWGAGWRLAAFAGIFLGLGRFNPLYAPLAEALPVLRMVRYPEKFLVLSAATIPVLAGLGWQHLMTARRRGEVERAHLPAGIALAAALVAAGAALLVAATPVGEAFVRTHGDALATAPEVLAARAAWLARQWGVAAGLAAAAVPLLLLVRRRRFPEGLLAAAALALLAGDLVWHGAGLNPTRPSSELLRPPAALAAAPPGSRLFVAAGRDRANLEMRLGPVGFQQLYGRRERLEPYSALLWGRGYALHNDYDLMGTRWARWARQRHLAAPREALPALLAAWDVTTVVVKKPPERLVAEWRATGERPAPNEVLADLAALPRYRTAERLKVVTSEQADAALAATAWATRGSELCLAGSADELPAPGRYAPADIVVAAERGGRILLDYRAAAPALLVAAITFDPGWRATLAGEPLPRCATALGQLAVALPTGGGRVELVYRDRSLRVGAGLTLLGLVAALVLLRRP